MASFLTERLKADIFGIGFCKLTVNAVIALNRMIIAGQGDETRIIADIQSGTIEHELCFYKGNITPQAGEPFLKNGQMAVL